VKIKVPDIPGPIKRLCWKQSREMWRCDRRKGHKGPHSWELIRLRQVEQWYEELKERVRID
jgi:hypothetical protein